MAPDRAEARALWHRLELQWDSLREDLTRTAHADGDDDVSHPGIADTADASGAPTASTAAAGGEPTGARAKQSSAWESAARSANGAGRSADRCQSAAIERTGTHRHHHRLDGRRSCRGLRMAQTPERTRQIVNSSCGPGFRAWPSHSYGNRLTFPNQQTARIIATLAIPSALCSSPVGAIVSIKRSGRK